MLNKSEERKMNERQRRMKRKNMNRVLSLNFSGKSAIKNVNIYVVRGEWGKSKWRNKAKERASERTKFLSSSSFMLYEDGKVYIIL